jgi:hypothetical protein
MGQLVFQATLGGQVALSGPNTASSYTLSLPTITDTVATITGSVANVTGTVAIANGGTGLTSFTANQLHYGSFSTSANLTFNGTTLTSANDATISGLTVGKGGGSAATGTVLGYQALAVNTSGGNMALGYQALAANTTGDGNTAVGRYQTMVSNTTGNSNCAFGQQALQANTTASNNTAVGYQAGYSNSTGNLSVYIGSQAGYSNTTGINNAFVGYYAGQATTGGYNTFMGSGAGYLVTSGTYNTILGQYSGNQGGLDIRTASNYIVLSDGAGNPRGIFDGSGNLLIGRTTNPSGLSNGLYVLGTYSNTTPSGANVFINTDGSFFRSTSSLRYKDNVQDATHGLAEVLKLRSVTYNGKNARDAQTIFGGFIAEEIDAAGLNEFVVYDEDGNPDALQYGNMVALMAKAIQEQQAFITSLTARITALENK